MKIQSYISEKRIVSSGIQSCIWFQYRRARPRKSWKLAAS